MELRNSEALSEEAGENGSGFKKEKCYTQTTYHQEMAAYKKHVLYCGHDCSDSGRVWATHPQGSCSY